MSSATTSNLRENNGNTATNTTAGTPATSTTTTIQLDTMSLDQLNTLKQREEQRLQALSQRYSALRQAAARINAAKYAVQQLFSTTTTGSTTTSSTTGIVATTTTTTNKDDSETVVDTTTTTKDVFVPLTESVYVPGKITIRRSAAQQEPQPIKPNVDDGTSSSKNNEEEEEEEKYEEEPPLLIELGTGYFVEQNSQATTDYLQRKLQLVDANSDNVTQAIQATRQNMESIAIAMRGKFIEIQARQQGQRTKQLAAVAEEN